MFSLTTNKIHFLILNIGIIVMYGLIYKKYGDNTHFYFTNKEKKMDMIDALYFSATTYVTIGNNDIYPKTQFMKKIILSQIFFLLGSLILIGYSHI